MKSMKSYNSQIQNMSIPDDLMDKIIQVAYGDASIRDRMLIRKLSRQYPSIKKVLEEYKETAKSVHSISLDRCPEELINSILVKTSSNAKSSPSLFYDLYYALFARPAVTLATIVILTATVLTAVLLRQNDYYNGYNKAEVELANRQAKYALSLIGKVFNSTSNSLKNDVLTDKVSKPINEGIKTVNKIFVKKGEKNEN